MSYACAFDKFLNSNKHNYTDNYNWAHDFYYYYYDWLKITDFESNEHLRSKGFLGSFQEYIEGMVDFNTSMKAIGCYPIFSLIDNFIDNYHLNPIFSNASNQFHQTPHEVIQEKDGIRLLRYHQHPESPQYKKNTPLLIVYAPINRYHIMDISADRSIVKQFVSNAFDVFLLDWGNQKNNKLTITDYISCIDQSVEKIKNITKSETISLFGYSWGGVLSIIYSSLYNSKIKNLIVQSSHADFDKDNSIIAEWARNFPVEKFVEEFKEMFGHLIDMAFLMRNPLSHTADNMKYTLKMQEYGLKFIDNLVHISSWLHNTPDIPGEFFKQFIIDLYQKNLLIQNKMNLTQNEKMTKTTTTTTAIDLRKITMPILNIVGIYDDLVPSASSIPLNDVISSNDKKLIEFPAGHVEICISSSAHADLWPQVVKWLEERS
ncbi:MAG: alpha/beta fold hydrolase [Thermoproteota archaeon]|nr:alpha/beta fold hydrolase [Thermoproteota archaeon]